MKPIYCISGDCVLVTDKKFFVLNKNDKFQLNQNTPATDNLYDMLFEIKDFIYENSPDDTTFIMTEFANDGLNIKYYIYVKTTGRLRYQIESDIDRIKEIASEIGLIFSKEYQKKWGT
jgi:hypothetical protein